jgi:predicted component of type VI protein secretion system
MPKLTLVTERRPLKVYDLNGPVMRIGRGDGMDVVIDNVSVSRRQAEIRLEGGHWVVRDLGTGNGTFLNGQRVEGDRALKPGDELSFGKFSLFFDHVPAEPVVEVRTAPAANVQSTGTLLLQPEEMVKLRQAMAQKRQAQLQWEASGKKGVHYLTSGSTMVGRTELCDLQVPIRGPKQHILVVREGSTFEVRNLSWWYGMKVNGGSSRRATLQSGDRIDVGGLRLTFVDEMR